MKAADFILTFAVPGTGAGSARIRVFHRLQRRRLILATQLPETEYAGPSITEAAAAAIAACVSRYGRGFTFVEHYNRASYGLQLCEPSFNRVEWAETNTGISVLRSPAMPIEELCADTGLSDHEIRSL